MAYLHQYVDPTTVSPVSGESKQQLTKDEYSHLKLHRYQMLMVKPNGPTSGAGLIYAKRDGRLLTTKEDRVPIHQGPLKDPKQPLMFDHINLTDAYGEAETAEAERLFNLLNPYRYEMVLLRENDRNPDETKRLRKLLSEELQQKLRGADAFRAPDYYLGRHGINHETKQPTVSWQPQYIVFDDETEPDEDARVKRARVGGLNSAKAFKFSSVPDGVVLDPPYWKPDKNKMALESPFAEASIRISKDGTVCDDHFKSPDEAKASLTEYLTLIDSTRLQRAEDVIATGKKGAVTFANFELSRWGNEGLLDNWEPILKLVDEKATKPPTEKTPGGSWTEAYMRAHPERFAWSDQLKAWVDKFDSIRHHR